YKKNKNSFLRSEVVHASHIVKNVDENNDETSARAAIEEAEAELKAGADFAEVADRRSDCPGRGGDLGWFPRGQMVDEFEKFAFALQPGHLSEIFRSPFGFHIVKLQERRPAGPQPLEEVREQIEQTLISEKRQRVLEQYLDKLRAQAKVEITAKA